MSGRPAVTVVIPTRDRPRWLRRAVRLALGQQDVDVQVLVVDDASTDRQAVEAASGDDARVRLLRGQRSPAGVSVARNAGLAATETPIVAFLDDDDVWHPGWLRTATDALTATSSEAVVGPVALLDGDGRLCGWEPAAQPGAVREGLLRYNVVGGPSQVVLATDAVREAGGFNPGYAGLADWDLWLRLRDRAWTATDRVLVGYTVHPDSLHLRDPDALLAEFRRLREASGFATLDEVAFKRWLANDCARFGNRRDAIRLFSSVGIDERRPGDLAHAARLAVPLHTGIRRRFARRVLEPWRLEGEELEWLARGGDTVGTARV